MDHGAGIAESPGTVAAQARRIDARGLRPSEHAAMVLAKGDGFRGERID